MNKMAELKGKRKEALKKKGKKHRRNYVKSMVLLMYVRLFDASGIRICPSQSRNLMKVV